MTDFHYPHRWRELGGLFLPDSLDDQLVHLLEDRDRNLEDYLKNLSPVPTTCIRRTSTSTISDNTLTQVDMNSTPIDQLGTADLTNDLITTPSPGVYLVTFNIQWAENVTGDRFIFIGGTDIGNGNLAGNNFLTSANIANAVLQSAAFCGPFDAGVEFYGGVQQQSGGNLTLNAAHLSVTKLSPL